MNFGCMDEYITPEQMRKAEEMAVSNGVSIETLMENAGRGVADEVEKHYGPVRDKKIVIIIGKGNNGGDGSVAARHLSGMGAKVSAILLAKPEEIRTKEARLNWDRLVASSTKIYLTPDVDSLHTHKEEIIGADILIAAILGTGIKGEIREPEAEAIQLVNMSHAIKIAVDIPSGLDPGTGEIKDPTVIADLTVTMHRLKVGMKNNERITGKVVTVQIGID